jgi:hypothetical protein
VCGLIVLGGTLAVGQWSNKNQGDAMYYTDQAGWLRSPWLWLVNFLWKPNTSVGVLVKYPLL